ncbi:Stk1 family PASTA domain-containing Ser/Thr kinase [Bacillus carboniphilus]|uniref:non-specific serine/threonine protein kinase n=1 Tax=Bacillus carboniphilus TaxID=86663 RepID=A0ABY9JYP8_9BACI|nr:Stk1 family PASTA domain-containing Ser/Thr kinase [Bacillus carboniphilus]WLR43575.1 Stk1 family PASTA domain-containing Ser/Thr kinase [Bacillus carboniphilus]
MLIGKRISGRYKILEVIGGGGMANVYLARDVILDRNVAIKILRFDFVNDNDFIRRFRREAQSATSLAHPNIVSIYDVGEEKDIYYIVMEYVEGKTLKQYIAQHAPLHPKEALHIQEQIVSAINHAHENGIVHRDIKPHNILVDQHGNIKVTDFGIAVALSSTTITQTNSVLGSVHYLSPEQARGGLATNKSDIYSLGIVLFEMLTGRLPFDGESAISIALKHLQSEPPSIKRWNTQVPQSVENLVLKSMAKDPFHRYESAADFGDDIKTALDGDRLYEPRFTVPEHDHEKTKAIPVISDSLIEQNQHDETLVHTPNKLKQKDLKNNQGNTTKKLKKKKNRWPKIIVSTFFVLVLSIILALFIFPSLFMPEDIEVPDISGLKLEEGIELLEAADFQVGEQKELEDDEIPEGYVIKTDPEGGSSAKEDSLVNIYVSLGKGTYTLENYIGENYNEVAKELQEAGFTVNSKEQSNDQEAGTILKQSLEKDEELVPDETTITFVVSSGLETYQMDDLTGYTKNEVKSYLEGKDIELESEEDYSEKVPEGQVISQTPSPNKTVYEGETIKVTYSLGPKLVAKTETKEFPVEFVPTEERPEAILKILVEDSNRDFSAPYLSKPISGNVSETVEFKIEPGQVGKYEIYLDEELLKEGEVPYPE